LISFPFKKEGARSAAKRTSLPFRASNFEARTAWRRLRVAPGISFRRAAIFRPGTVLPGAGYKAASAGHQRPMPQPRTGISPAQASSSSSH